MRRLLVGGLVALLLAPVPALAAEGDPEAGWWSRTKLGGGAPAEAPDTVPAGGTQVAGDPAGTVSVAAYRVAPAPGTRVSALRLPVARSTGTPDVQVCPTAARWQPVDGGRLDAAPPADCAGETVKGTVEDGVLVVTLPESFGADALDVRLQPAAGAVFSLDLAPATAQAVVTSPVAAAEPTAEPAAPAPAPAAPAAPPPAPAAPAPAAADTGFPAVEPAPALVADAPAAAPPLVGADAPPLPAEALPPEVPAAAPPAAGEPQAPVAAVFPRPAEGLDGRREQLWALALLAGLVALGVQLFRTPARAAVRLGGAARISRGEAGPEAVPAPVAAAVAAVPPRERGVGRFRAVRVRPPVRL